MHLHEDLSHLMFFVELTGSPTMYLMLSYCLASSNCLRGQKIGCNLGNDYRLGSEPMDTWLEPSLPNFAFSVVFKACYGFVLVIIPLIG
eukprot:1472826-Amphidinium_carterae.1